VHFAFWFLHLRCRLYARLNNSRHAARDSRRGLVVLLILLLGGGGGYYGYSRWGSGGGAGVGLSSVLVVLLAAYLLGVIH